MGAWAGAGRDEWPEASECAIGGSIDTDTVFSSSVAAGPVETDGEEEGGGEGKREAPPWTADAAGEESWVAVAVGGETGFAYSAAGLGCWGRGVEDAGRDRLRER